MGVLQGLTGQGGLGPCPPQTLRQDPGGEQAFLRHCPGRQGRLVTSSDPPSQEVRPYTRPKDEIPSFFSPRSNGNNSVVGYSQTPS